MLYYIIFIVRWFQLWKLFIYDIIVKVLQLSFYNDIIVSIFRLQALIKIYCCSGLGEPCQTHRNCYIRDSYCVTGYCACTLKYHPNPRNDGCIPSIGKYFQLIYFRWIKFQMIFFFIVGQHLKFEEIIEKEKWIANIKFELY